MPSGLSQVEIVNKALILIGDQAITAMSENNERARIMDALWDGTRDSLLRECPWNFATKRASLAASTSTPIYQWANAFPLPSDFLYMVSTEGNSPYRLEGGSILSNTAGSLKITYIKRVTVVTDFDAGFADALSAKLAYQASKKLSADPGLERSLFLDAQIAVTNAKRIDGMEDDPVSYTPDDWEFARGAGFSNNVANENW